MGQCWQFRINSKLSCECGLSALTSESGDVITDDLERANLLNTNFTSMCADNNGTSPTLDRAAGLHVESDIETIVFTPGFIVNAAISKL